MWRAVLAAVAAPWRRATTWSANAQRAPDAGGDAGRGDDPAVIDEAGLLDYLGVREGFAQPRDRDPVGGGALLIEEAGVGQEQGAGADAGGQLGLPVLGGDPGEHRPVGLQAAGALAAGHHQDIERRMIGDGVVRLD